MIEYAVTTEIGDKEKNEDSVRVFVNQKYSTYGFVAADGLVTATVMSLLRSLRSASARESKQTTTSAVFL